jgi:hypothetical protein
MDGGTGPYPSNMAGSSVRPSSESTGTVMRTWAAGDGTSPAGIWPASAPSAGLLSPAPTVVPCVVPAGVRSRPAVRSQVAVMSARSWVRGLASSAPWRALAAVVARSQIPAAWLAGRYAESQAMPSQSGAYSHPPVGDAAAVAFFDADRVVPFPPGTGLRPEPGRDEVPCLAAARRGGCVRVQEMRLQTRSPHPVEVAGFVHHDPGMLPRNPPGLQRGQRQRQGGGQCAGFGQKGTGGAFADREDTRDLSDHGHVLGGVFLRGHGRCRHGFGSLGVSSGEVHFQGGHSSFHAGHLSQPVQARIRLVPKRVSTGRAPLARPAVD